MKFYGVIGYVETVETEPGIWEEKNTERAYCGDLIRNFGKHEPSGNVNDNINIANEVSIIADPYIMEHFWAIRYVKFTLPALSGAWKVTDVEVASPRLILTIGGVYNGNTAGTPGKA